MSEERVLRAVLEQAQARLRDLEAKSGDLERRRNLAEQRTRELESELTASRERIQQLEAAGGAALSEELQRLQNRIGTLELQMKQADTITPRLPAAGVCARCGASSVIAPIVLRAAMPGALVDPNVVLKQNKGTSRITAKVCTRCGLTELTAEAPQLL
jgi:ribosomal protein L40E